MRDDWTSNDPFDWFNGEMTDFEESRRPEPVRCARCKGFVYGPVAGESAKIVRFVRFHTQAEPHNMVCPCAKCGRLYEVSIQKAA